MIPVKAPGEGKTRLAEVLDGRQRQALVSAMLERVIDAARGCKAVRRVCLVGPSDHGLGITLLDEHGDGLNQVLFSTVRQLSEGIASSWEAEPNRIIIAPADLPRIDANDFDMLAGVPGDAIGIAPDRHGTGTNALSLPSACTDQFTFAYGTASFAAHRAEAERLGYKIEVLLSAGLEKDIDEPADLADATGCMQEA
ncbi:2-phospho-L-lactate guanylyltransferase [Novosphingobium sp. 9U]|uniref:2-phospho-L-lactate guanylyltransferase n=1 Tax=Novosphingobium sp. 9U TaxID=2653158 RepID=UPI001F288F6A|nr:2-phospho-L-lactate guanylyltransferase [Novosphingobium sp. 9U]